MLLKKQVRHLVTVCGFAEEAPSRASHPIGKVVRCALVPVLSLFTTGLQLYST